MQKNFKKLTCRFNDEILDFSADKAKMTWFLKDHEEDAQKMFQEIKLACNSFSEFRQALRFRSFLELSFYIFFPIVFILAIAGFESGFQVFGLAWFFLGFLIVYVMILVIIIYYVTVRVNEFFSSYSLNSQEIINKYNRKVFIKNNVFVSFRFQIYDGRGRPKIDKNGPAILANNQGLVIKSNSLSKDREPQKNVNGIKFKLRSQFRSSLSKILRIKFWVEFLIKEKEEKGLERNLKNELELEVKQEKNVFYHPQKKEDDYEERVVLKQPERIYNDQIEIQVEEENKNRDEEEEQEKNSNNFDKVNNQVMEENDG